MSLPDGGLPRVGILISGSGSNMVRLVEGMRAGEIAGTPAVVVSSEPDAPGLARAAALGVPTIALDWRSKREDRSGFHADVAAALADHGVGHGGGTGDGAGVIACAGYMRIMSEDFVARYAGRMVNIHPSILPLFKGLDTHARALEAGMAVHGCTVHEVTAELDSGAILGQAVVPVEPGDTPESLAARVLVQEHRLYPRVLDAFLSDPATARAAPIALFPDG